MHWLAPLLAIAQVAPDAPCPNVRPSDATCCQKTSTGPVLGGIDFVDLATKRQGKDAPIFGVSSFSATLNNYTFLFSSGAANAKTFEASPWSFAPAWGGF